MEGAVLVCPLRWPAMPPEGAQPAEDFPSPAHRCVDARTVREVPSAPWTHVTSRLHRALWSPRTRWARWASRTRRTAYALLLVAVVVCALPSQASASSGPSPSRPGTTPSTSALFASGDGPRRTNYTADFDDRRHSAHTSHKRAALKHEHDDMRTPIVPLGHGGGGCSLCREREAIRNWSLAAIREQILHKLNLQHPPNITGRHVPKYETLQSFFEPMQGDDPRAGPAAGSVFRAREDDEDDYHAKTERIIAFPQSHSNKVRHGLQGHNVLHFRFSPKVMQSQVARASLWVYLRGTGRPHHHRYHAHHFEDEDGEDEEREDRTPPTVLVHVMRLRGRGSGADGPALELEAMTKVPQPDNDGLWVEVDIKKMVEDWFRRPRDIQGLVVQAEAGGRQLVNSDTNDEDNPKMPFIEVYLKEGRKRRVRRAPSLNCDENSEESRCCRYPLVVDFERFGWDFIIFPKRYNAYYCSGECPYVYLQEYPHTALMHLANNKTGPCCAPRKMLSMNMLYFDNDLNVVFGVLPNMVVDRCGCF